MQQAREPYGTVYDSRMFDSPAPPRWPRVVARIVGTLGLVLIAPFALVMVIGTLGNMVGGSSTNNPPVLDYVMMSLMAIASSILALGLLVAWWKEGLGALLIFAGAGLLGIVTFGLSIPFTFPAPFVAALYLISWAFHRTGDTGNSDLERLSRWIRESYYGGKQERF